MSIARLCSSKYLRREVEELIANKSVQISVPVHGPCNRSVG